jgi:V8-like Glu-specific endopeptidase
LLVTSTHAPPQSTNPAWQKLEQLPSEQTLPTGQALLQFPQLAGSDDKSTHSPEQNAPVAQIVPPSPPGMASESSAARPHEAPAAANADANNRPERNRRKLDMARAPIKTPHTATTAAQSLAVSLHADEVDAKRFASQIALLTLRSLAVVTLGAASVLSCGTSAPTDPTRTTRSAIEDGTTDTTHTFAVGIVQITNDLAFCSGVLLAPNLVATARHCVAQTPSDQVQCPQTVFGDVLPVTSLYVTTSSVLMRNDDFASVVKIIVPTGADQTSVCGNDIALIILDHNIDLPQYVTPTISPPMTDHTLYPTTVTAIGYGLSTPLDEAGVTAGTRRIKQDIPLYCIPNDTTFANCFSDSMAMKVLSADEFVSGDASTCEGDSGSGAYDQTSFDKGSWVAYGVLSRGGVSMDGKTCIEPVYSRFDAWGPLLIQAATEAASMGGYSAPVWAGGTGPNLAATDASTDVASVSAFGDGTACGADSDCASGNCVSTDDVHFVCASPCGTGCATGSTCQAGYCFAGSSAAGGGPPPKGGGCAVDAIGARSAEWAEGLAVAGLLLVMRVRRRDRPSKRDRSDMLPPRRRA